MNKIKIKMVSLFSGAGMQERGVENTDCFELERVGSCDNDINAIIAYAAIHCDLTPELIATYPDYPSRQEMVDTLVAKNIGYDFVKDKAYNWQKLVNSADTKNQLKTIWLADKLSKNMGDITKVDELPQCGLVTWSFPCVTKDSLILTKEGYKPMEDVKVGDIVLTKSNTWHPVIKKFDNGVHNTCYLNAFGFTRLHCTLNHSFYIREKYFKTYKDENGIIHRDRLFKEPVFKEAKDLKKNDFLGIPVIQDEQLFYTDNLDFWYMIGYYIGDGYLSKTNYDIRLCCNDKKLEKLRPHIEALGYKYGINDSDISCHKLRFANKEVYELIAKYIGTGCENKKIPTEILLLPIEQLRAFLQGYIDSDGNILHGTKNDFVRITSINKQLAYSTMMIINKVYHRPASLYVNKPRKKKHYIDGREIKQDKPLFEVKFKYNTSKQDNAFYENGYIWYPFYNLIEAAPAHVYNIEVEEDHSYILQGCISKNCTDLSISGKQTGMSEGETRSGLAWEVLRILKNMKVKNQLPNFLLMENVDALVSKKFINDYENLNKEFAELGYDCKYQILNGKFCGVPQNRKRVFGLYALRDKVDLSKFEFPLPFDKGIRLKDVLEDEVDEKYYINNERTQELIKNLVETKPDLMESIFNEKPE